MHQVKKGNQWYFGMKAHIGVDAATGLAQRRGRISRKFLHGADARVGRRRLRGRGGRRIDWQVAQGRQRRPRRSGAVRAKVEHPFLYVKRHFGYAQVRYRGLAKNRTRLCVLLGFANLLLAERAAPA